uniref:Uncharacterized protein n=1 Tax=Amphimedon queenslandica TaxID=400682 RepID=I1EX43_AMPQE
MINVKFYCIIVHKITLLLAIIIILFIIVLFLF